MRQIEAEFISIHAPPRGATREVMACMILPRDFNSRPSARGDWRNGNTYCRFGISIHAPPRGATLSGALFLYRPPISIHAPPRGATVSRSASPAALPFQFTPLREGRRLGAGARYRMILFQFTPLREGRRWTNAGKSGILSYFNSRPSARGDAIPRRAGRHL